jgi:hypothetical protein
MDLKTYPPSECIKLLASYISFIITANDNKSNKDGRKPTRFHAKTIPSIDILGYLSRILKYAPCGTECFLAVIVYLQRISVKSEFIYLEQDLEAKLETSHISDTKEKDIVIDSYNIHRLLITASLVGIKFLSDVFYTNLHISRKKVF